MPTIFLVDEGFDVTICGKSEDALTRLALTLPVLLTLDGYLPGMPG